MVTVRVNRYRSPVLAMTCLAFIARRCHFFCVLPREGILAYRTLPLSKEINKMIHNALMFLAVVLISLALWAVFQVGYKPAGMRLLQYSTVREAIER